MSDQSIMDAANLGFSCKRCGYSTQEKSNFIRHLKRKTKCEAVLEDISIETLLDNITKKQYNQKTYNCKYCNRPFNAYQNRFKHHKICKKKDEIEGLQCQNEVINKMQQEIQDLKDKLQYNVHTTNNTNNGTINNIVNVNVQIREFGCENMAAIPPDFIRTCLLNLEVRDLVENLHFDHNFPENQNVRLVSLKHEIMELFKNNEWQAMSLLNGLNELIGQACSIFRKFYHNNKQEIHEDVGGELEALMLLEKLDAMDNMNEKLLKPIRTDIRALLYGKKNKNIKDGQENIS